jgi:hypothetical protein
MRGLSKNTSKLVSKYCDTLDLTLLSMYIYTNLELTHTFLLLIHESEKGIKEEKLKITNHEN